MSRSGRTAAAVLASLALALSGCGLFDDQTDEDDGAGRYPLTIENCGAEVEIEQKPEQVVLLTGTDVGFLTELGVLDTVVGKAGSYPEEYYDDEVNAAVEEIPELSSTLDETATLQISDEVILAAEPDLVLDAVKTGRADSLGGLGIPVLNDEAMCPAGLTDPGFDDVYSQLETYGRVFDREGQAAEAISRLEDRVAAVAESVPDDESRTAAVLYPVIGGSPRAYGNRSMAGAIVEAAGFTNVYDDLDERRAEISMEDLVDRDPDVLILLHVEGDPGEVEDALTSLPGADELTAVRNDDMMTMLFNFAEPPTPLAVDGLERIVEHFQGSQ